MEDLERGLLAVCKALQRCEVRYLLVGGAAVALHGHYRHSMGPEGNLSAKPDIDLWFDPTYENYYALLNVLDSIGHDVSEFKNEERPDPRHSFFRLDMDEFTLDALPHIHAEIRFADAYARKEEVELDGIPICYLGYEDLIEDKRCSARKKDQDDIEQLKRQRGEDRPSPTNDPSSRS